MVICQFRMYWEHPDPPLNDETPKPAYSVALGNTTMTHRAADQPCTCRICQGEYYPVNEYKEGRDKFLMTCKYCQARFHSDDPHANYCSVCG